MFTRAAAVTLALVMVATLGVGPVAPKPAEANDTGKVLAGLAAGALVYGMLDGLDRDKRTYDRRGYYDGNRNTWKYERDRRQFERHQDYRNYGPQRRTSSSYDRGWSNGYDRGFGDGRQIGYNQGYDRGYDRGYDNGWGDGYDYGRYGGGWWGY